MTIFLLILLPTLSFLSGFFSLEGDPKANTRTRNALKALLILSAIGSVIASLHENGDKRAEQRSATEQKNQDKAENAQLRDIIQGLSGKADNILNILRQRGFSPADIHRVQESQVADEARTRLLADAKASNAQHRTTVLYFPKDVDGPRVIEALKQGGFDVHQQRTGEKNQLLATNAIWVGNNVPLDKAKFVALTLIRAGVEIRALRRLQNGSAPDRANLIEVGSDAVAQQHPILTVDDIQNLKDLEVRN